MCRAEDEMKFNVPMEIMAIMLQLTSETCEKQNSSDPVEAQVLQPRERDMKHTQTKESGGEIMHHKLVK